MTGLYHVVLKDHENSGYVWDDFFCPDCLEIRVSQTKHLEVLLQTIATPEYLSHLYPPLINEPHCCNCFRMFNF